MPAQTETVAAGTPVEVTLIGEDAPAADLVAIGSHCVGLEMLVGLLEAEGVRCKTLAVGSSGGLAAAGRGECDLAGIHLMDPATGEYNRAAAAARGDAGPGLWAAARRGGADR